MYADDSTATATAKTTQELNVQLKHDATEINTWCSDNHMAVNTSRTKVMLVTNWHKRLSLPADQQKLSIQKLSQQILRISINQNLSVAEHLKKTTATVNSKVALLMKIKSFLHLSTQKLFCNTHILPHIDYCSIIWGSSPNIHSLLLARKRAARIILDIKDTMYPSREMFSKLKWMPITDHIKYHKASMVFRSINNLALRYMSDMFKNN